MVVLLAGSKTANLYSLALLVLHLIQEWDS